MNDAEDIWNSSKCTTSEELNNSDAPPQFVIHSMLVDGRVQTLVTVTNPEFDLTRIIRDLVG